MSVASTPPTANGVQAPNTPQPSPPATPATPSQPQQPPSQPQMTVQEAQAEIQKQNVEIGRLTQVYNATDKEVGKIRNSLSEAQAKALNAARFLLQVSGTRDPVEEAKMNNALLEVSTHKDDLIAKYFDLAAQAIHLFQTKDKFFALVGGVRESQLQAQLEAAQAANPSSQPAPAPVKKLTSKERKAQAKAALVAKLQALQAEKAALEAQRAKQAAQLAAEAKQATSKVAPAMKALTNQTNGHVTIEEVDEEEEEEEEEEANEEDLALANQVRELEASLTHPPVNVDTHAINQ